MMPLFSHLDPPIKDTRIEFDIVIAARGGALRAEQKVMVLRKIFGQAVAAAVEKERRVFIINKCLVKYHVCITMLGSTILSKAS